MAMHDYYSSPQCIEKYINRMLVSLELAKWYDLFIILLLLVIGGKLCNSFINSISKENLYYCITKILIIYYRNYHSFRHKYVTMYSPYNLLNKINGMFPILWRTNRPRILTCYSILLSKYNTGAGTYTLMHDDGRMRMNLLLSNSTRIMDDSNYIDLKTSYIIICNIR